MAQVTAQTHADSATPGTYAQVVAHKNEAASGPDRAPDSIDSMTPTWQKLNLTTRLVQTARTNCLGPSHAAVEQSHGTMRQLQPSPFLPLLVFWLQCDATKQNFQG